jgi:hypothetical protein
VSGEEAVGILPFREVVDEAVARRAVIDDRYTVKIDRRGVSNWRRHLDAATLLPIVFGLLISD